VARSVGRDRGSAAPIGANPGGIWIGAAGADAFWTGDFAELDRILRASIDRLGPEPWDESTRTRFVYQRALAGALGYLRGDGDAAAAAFDDALSEDGGVEVREAQLTALLLRALLASDDRAEGALADVAAIRASAEALGRADGVPLAGVAEGWALARLGRTEESLEILRPLTTELPADMGRALASLALAEVLLQVGDRRSARRAVDVAREAYFDADARYWCARAALLTGAIERDRAGRWLRLARELSLDDPAYEQLFLPKGSLRIESAASPAVWRNGEPVRFITRHAEITVRLLASAHPDGLAVEEIIELFWPDVSGERQRARLRTLLWQVRNSLGADSWRVQRSRDFVVFDTEGVEVVGSVTPRAIAEEFIARRAGHEVRPG